ncbi:MAG: hypothetical protein LDL01_03825 [Ignavibacterium sp.]|nr:hypothetical protein [Ignavibacterium sp.]
MNTNNFVKKNLLPLILLAIISFFVGCQEESSLEATEPKTDKEAMIQIADEDSLLTSFEPNYNEDGVMDIMGKVNVPIYPVKVGQKMRLVNRVLDINIQGDTAYGTLTKTFEGTLFILAKYDSTSTEPDTLIQKTFTSTITRKLVFIKIANTEFPKRNWILAAVSLPEGGTNTPLSIDITKMTVFLPNGDTLVINSPNDYYLYRRWGFWWRWRNFPVVPGNSQLTIRVELTSAYEQDDFVTLTFGADARGLHRAKKRFVLVNSTFNGTAYAKVYEQTFQTHQYRGFFHAILNAMPGQVVLDDSAPVEQESWGVPYFVRP